MKHTLITFAVALCCGFAGAAGAADASATGMSKADYKAQKDNTVESRVGTLPLELGYYYCQTCRTGLFPPGSTTGPVGQPLE